MIAVNKARTVYDAFADDEVMAVVIASIPDLDIADMPLEYVARMMQEETDPEKLLELALIPRIYKLLDVANKEVDALGTEEEAYEFLGKVNKSHGDFSHLLKEETSPALWILFETENCQFILEDEGVMNWGENQSIFQHSAVDNLETDADADLKEQNLRTVLDIYNEETWLEFEQHPLITRAAVQSDGMSAFKFPVDDFFQEFVSFSFNWVLGLTYAKYVDRKNLGWDDSSPETSAEVWLCMMETFTWFCEKVDALPDPK